MKVLVVCGNGSGTSLMLKKSVEKAAQAAGIRLTQVHQTNISEGKNTAKNFDAVFTPANFKKDFDRVEKNHDVVVVGIRNVMSADEVEKQMVETGLVDKYK